jgi:hypothetical protein
MNIKAIPHIIRIARQIILPILFRFLLVIDDLSFNIISRIIKPIILRIIRIKAIIYIAFTPHSLNPRSAKPHIKKAKLNTLAPIPVKAAQFGC